MPLGWTRVKSKTWTWLIGRRRWEVGEVSSVWSSQEEAKAGEEVESGWSEKVDRIGV